MNIENIDLNLYKEVCGSFDWYIAMIYEIHPEIFKDYNKNNLIFCDGENHYYYKNGYRYCLPHICPAQNEHKKFRIIKQFKIKNNAKSFDEVDAYFLEKCSSTIDLIKKYCVYDSQKNLILSGVTGSGKTFLSKSILLEFLQRGHSVLFLRIKNLIDIFHEMNSKEFEISDKAKNKFLSIFSHNYVVIDELGGNYNFGYERENFIFDFQNFLDEKEKRSNCYFIYTTNLNSNQLRAIVGEKNFSRIMQNTKLIEFPNFDYRKKDIKNLKII